MYTVFIWMVTPFRMISQQPATSESLSKISNYFFSKRKLLPCRPPKVPKNVRAWKVTSKTAIDMHTLKSWYFTMVSRYERAHLSQNFIPGNAFIFKIRRKYRNSCEMFRELFNSALSPGLVPSSHHRWPNPGEWHQKFIPTNRSIAEEILIF